MPSNRLPTLPYWVRYISATLATGVSAGIVGWLCTRLLHGVEAVVWNHHSGTFLDSVSASVSWHRPLILLAAGVLGAISWTVMFRKNPHLTSVKAGVEGETLPPLRTVWHALTQIVLVGMGASIGREVAPREVSASLSSWISSHCGLSAEDRRIIVACGAGAGLSAVYSIPISGAVYALEILLLSKRPKAVVTASFIAVLSVLVSTGWHLPAPFYSVEPLKTSWGLVIWALIMGPVLGALGELFRMWVDRCEQAKPQSAHLLWSLPLAFVVVGLIAMVIPSVLGNGQASAQTQFDARWLAGAGLITALLVLVAKTFTTLVTIRAGAWGGTLTPGVALGAGIGAVTGLVWQQVVPSVSVAACVFIGAAIFLGSSMAAPLTGLTLVFEFTGFAGLPIVGSTGVALVGSVLMTAWIRKRREARRLAEVHATASIPPLPSSD